MENYFFKKEVDLATLHQGFTIPRKQHNLFLHNIKYNLKPGEHLDIIFLINNEKFIARMRNVNFNKKRYPDHTPILQIRYDNNKFLINKLQSLFLNSYNYISNERKLKDIKGKKYIKIPDPQKEFLILYSTELSDTFVLDYLTFKENNDLKNIIKEKEISENTIELILNEKDYNAKIELQHKLIKVRKLNYRIAIRLKELYDYKCQICGYTA
ncbi:MAG: hypothetical protein ISS80_05945, partial [Candidatus Cloacimonetes bacterium]|nr:hypothetical protein [Candidatus Cloacimonadota bacterium]